MSVTDDYSQERWLPMVGCERAYEVSDHARVRSIDRVTPHGHFRKGCLMKLRVSSFGYVVFNWKPYGQKARDRGVHIAVLEAFDCPRPAGMFACHGPAGKSDNRPGNLSWGTPKQNMADRLRDGTALFGEDVPTSKLNDDKVRQIRLRQARGESNAAISRDFDVSRVCISQVGRGITWSHVT
jgi:hypothetical protein